MAESKFTVLVLGDSFSLLDDEHSYWAREWATERGGTTVHLGLPGCSHVNAVARFLHADIDLNTVSGIVYCMTDLFRSEARKEPHFADIYSNHPDLNWESIYTSDIDTDTHWPEYGHSVFTMPGQYANQKETTKFYDCASLRWIAKANLYSIELVAYKAKEFNVPIIYVDSLWRQGNALRAKHFPEWTYHWHYSESNYPPNPLMAQSDSTNHIDLNEAVTIAAYFQDFLEEHDIQILPKT